MTGPLSGVRVVELGMWVAAPAATSLLCDWGADVVKIEPAAGDPYRRLFSNLLPDIDIEPTFGQSNRGKRSIAIDVLSDEGRQAVGALLERADVFVTNLRLGALDRLGLRYEQLQASYPGLVYCSITGHGETGPDAHRPSYDIGAFWARSGIAAAMTPEGGPPPTPRGGFGDHATAMAAANGILAALFERERTGRGQLVATSLLRSAAYLMAFDLSIHLATGVPVAPMSRTAPMNPLANSYQAADGLWFWLLGIEGDRHWSNLARAVGHETLEHDPRFASATARTAHSAELVAVLDAEFERQPLREWTDRFDRNDVWWSPVQKLESLLADEQSFSAGIFAAVEDDSREWLAVAGPVDVASASKLPFRSAPRLGEHTEEILRELGLRNGDQQDRADEAVSRGS